MSTRATKEALDLLAKYIEDSGPCEHAANICVCGEKQVVDDARAELEAIERAARDISAYLSHGQPERYCLALALFDRIATSAK